MSAHHPTLGYRYAGNKGRIIQDLIDRNTAKHLGPDFHTLIGKNGKLDLVLSNRNSFLNMTIEAGSIASTFKNTIINKTHHKIKQTTLDYKKANWEKFQKTIEENINLMDMNNKTKDMDHEILR